MKLKWMKIFRLKREERSPRPGKGPKRRFFRCPACRAVQAVPTGGGQSKVVCRRCGEIFLRRT